MVWASSASSTPTGTYQVETPEPARASDVLSRVGSLMQTAYVCRDSEISAYGVGNKFALRTVNNRGVWADFGTTSATINYGWRNHNPASGVFAIYPYAAGILTLTYSSIPGYVTNNAGDVWTFGASGFDLYLKYNGTEVARVKHFQIFQAGNAVVYGTAASTATVAYVPATLIGSDRKLNIIDIRDAGAKTTLTTGSMSAGSNQLVVASASGFAVGDQVIVAVGGEAGLGRRGSDGVGGAWPALSYATTTARDADLSQPAGTAAWVKTSGTVYFFNSGAWGLGSTGFGYYLLKAVPYALTAVITAIAGNTLTLSKNAVAATSGASVHVDCTPAFKPFTDVVYNGFMLEYLKLRVPAGRFAVAGRLNFNEPASGGRWVSSQVIGAGKTVSVLFPPKGAEEIYFNMNYVDDLIVTGLKIEGNNGLGTSGEVDGYALCAPTEFPNAEWPQCLRPTSAARSAIYDCAFENTFRAVAHSSTTASWLYRCTLTMTGGAQEYTQWQFSFNGCTGGGAYDCSVTGPKFIKAFESFAGSSQTYTRVGGQNALFSPNSSQGIKLLEWDSTVTADAYGFLGAGYFGEAILNLNANAYHAPVDIYVRNPRIRQLGYARTSDSTSMYAIQISPDCYNVVIEGAYTSEPTPGASTTLGGYIEAVNYVPGSGGGGGSVAIIDQGNNTTITGIRAVGAVQGTTYKSIDNAGAVTAGTIQGCIADTFGYKTGTTKSGNRTNAGVAVP